MAGPDDPERPDLRIGVRKFLAHCRNHTGPGDIRKDYYERLSAKSRTKKKITMGMMAEMLDVTERYYSKFESSGGRGRSAKMATKIIEIFELDSIQARGIYRWAGFPVPQEARLGDEVGSDVRLLLSELRHAAFVLSQDFRVLAHNDLATTLFPWMDVPGISFMQWILFHPDESLPDWRKSWAEPMMSFIRARMASDGRNEGLNSLLEDILSNPPTQVIWDAMPDMQSAVYGSTRPIPIVDELGKLIHITFQAVRPNGRPDLLIVIARRTMGEDEFNSLKT